MPAKQQEIRATRRSWCGISLAILALVFAGCGGNVKVVKNTPQTERPVAMEATRDELLEKYNTEACAVNSINATVELKPTAGSKYSGVIEEYHEVKAFLLAQRPASIRVIGQAPVIGTTVFDMVSDGQTFRVSIPSKNKFLVGAVSLERNSSKPIENLRPQHLLNALLWPEVRKEETVLFEEFNDETARYYVLTVLRGGYQTEILRKIWFDRAKLEVARLENFGPHGMLLSDTRFSDWEPVNTASSAPDNAAAAPPSGGLQQFPRTIRIDRPHDDYRLDLQIAKITLNENIPADRFQLEQPAGSELIHVGETADSKPPSQDTPPQGAGPQGAANRGGAR